MKYKEQAISRNVFCILYPSVPFVFNISYEIRQKKKNGAADVQYPSELVSIFCVDLSPPSCFFFVAVSELAMCVLL